MSFIERFLLKADRSGPGTWARRTAEGRVGTERNYLTRELLLPMRGAPTVTAALRWRGRCRNWRPVARSDLLQDVATDEVRQANRSHGRLNGSSKH
jgi:hypothetical protein